MIECKTYKLKTEFFPLLNISLNSYKYRKNDLLNWLDEFFNYEIKDGKPIYIVIHEQYQEYEQLPKNPKTQKELTERKIKDYEEYTKNNLGVDWICESKAHMANQAINSFGKEKYKHRNKEAVARRYVGPAMEKYGQKTEERYWAWYSSYEQCTDQEVLGNWKSILSKYKVGEKDIVQAFYEDRNNNDNEKMNAMIDKYQLALNTFKMEYGDILVYVPKWKLK